MIVTLLLQLQEIVLLVLYEKEYVALLLLH